MAVEHLEVGSVAVGLIVDGVEDTPWIAGTLTYEAERGVLVEVPYLDHAAAFGEDEGKQFGHVERWFSYENPTPPSNLLMRLQEGDVSLFGCRMTNNTSNWGRGSAFGKIGAEHVVLADRNGPHEAPLEVNRLESRLDGLNEWTRLSAVTEERFSDPETALLKSLHLTIKSEGSIDWKHGEAKMSIRSHWHLSGPRELRTVHDDVVVVSEFDAPRSVEDHLAAHRQVANLLIVLFGVPINFRRHQVSGDHFAVQYGERVHTPYRELITRSTYREHQEPTRTSKQLGRPLLPASVLGAAGIQRWSEHHDEWERVILPLVGRLRRAGAMVEDRVVSASMALEAAGHLVGHVEDEEQTYTRGGRPRPTTATYVFRVLADLGIALPQAGEAMVGIARAIANNYNAIKHFDRGRFPDPLESYLLGRIAMIAVRLYLAKLALGREEKDEDADPIAAWTEGASELASIALSFESESMYISRDGSFVISRVAQ